MTFVLCRVVASAAGFAAKIQDTCFHDWDFLLSIDSCPRISAYYRFPTLHKLRDLGRSINFLLALSWAVPVLAHWRLLLVQ